MSRSRVPLALGLTAAGGIGYYVRRPVSSVDC